MGHRKRSAPRRGSLGVRPRKRAASIIPRIRSWPVLGTQEVKLLGFMGYKVGMSHAFIIDDRPGSPTEGKEVFTPVTVIETPPMIVAGIRLYGYDPNRGKYSLTEAWAPVDVLKNAGIDRLVKRFMFTGETKAKLDRAESLLDEAVDVRAIMMAQPKLTGGVPKKTPELIEIALSGQSVKDKFAFLAERLGTPMRINEVFEAGMFVDVIAVTKGKGFQGVVKRFGVKELPRWHKHRKGSRKVGTRGSRVGALSTTPQAGQTGFHQRVDYNKRIIMIGVVREEEDPREIINPPGGWHKYGLVRSDFVVLAGSVPGSRKRPIFLRYPIRKTPWTPTGAPKITYLDTGHFLKP